MAGGIKAWRRRVRRKLLVRTEKIRRVFWRWFKRNSGKLTAILLIAWLCLIVIPPATLAQGVLGLWCRVFGFECWCWCWGADCVANAETVRNLALVVVGIWLVLAVREFLFRPEKTRQALGGCFKRNWQSFTAILSIVMVSLLWSYWEDIWCWFLDFWRWSRRDDGGQPISSNAETVRNLALGVGAGLAAAIGIPLALWRNILTHSQAKTAERDLNNERYQKGAEMLGNEALATRIGGIYALERLAEEHPVEYHIEIVKLLCAFIRYPTKRDDSALSDEEKRMIWFQAVVTAAQIIGRRSEEQIRIERSKGVELNLRDVDLSRVDLHDANFSGADLIRANLSDALLYRADLSGALLYRADLSGADLDRADLSGARLDEANLSDVNLLNANLSDVNLLNANLSDAKLDGVINLTQAQLNVAFVWEGCEPSISLGTVDSETGKPFEWQGGVWPHPFPDQPSSET